MSGQVKVVRTEKPCTKCKVVKPLSEYHASAKAGDGKASWCKPCGNACARVYRKKNYSREQKLRWARKSRYGITQKCFDDMFAKQGGLCAICNKPPKRQCLDHDHQTGVVRGILCHRCNLLIGGWDDREFRAAALAYLGIIVQQPGPNL